MAPHSSTLAWKIPWTAGRPGVLRFMVSQRVRQDWATQLNWTEYISNKILNTEVSCDRLQDSRKFYILSFHGRMLTKQKTTYTDSIFSSMLQLDGLIPRKKKSKVKKCIQLQSHLHEKKNCLIFLSFLFPWAPWYCRNFALAMCTVIWPSLFPSLLLSVCWGNGFLEFRCWNLRYRILSSITAFICFH